MGCSLWGLVRGVGSLGGSVLVGTLMGIVCVCEHWW